MFCIPYTDCGETPQGVYSTVDDENGPTTVGSSASYSCNEDYVLVGDPIVLTCDGTGSWGNSDSTCNAGNWLHSTYLWYQCLNTLCLYPNVKYTSLHVFEKECE
jgi:hypothetical protein